MQKTTNIYIDIQIVTNLSKINLNLIHQKVIHTHVYPPILETQTTTYFGDKMHFIKHTIF
jgi:hypothetical protein